MEEIDRITKIEREIQKLAASQRQLALSISNLASAFEKSNQNSRKEAMMTDADLSVLIFTVICSLLHEGGLERTALIEALDKAMASAAAAKPHQPAYSPTEYVLEALRNWQQDSSHSSGASNLQ